MFGTSSICAFAFIIAQVTESRGQVTFGGPMPRYTAAARLRTADTSDLLLGQVQFVQYSPGAPTMVVGVLQLSYNQPHDQWLALHIHEYGDISDNCKWVGRHFNPHGQVHGGPLDYARHEGDLGNIAPTGNIALINITDRQIQLTGINTIIGRSLVLHVQRDDLGRGGSSDSFIDGHSGFPLACGVIGVKGDFSPASATAIGPCCCLIYAFFLLFAIWLQDLYE